FHQSISRPRRRSTRTTRPRSRSGIRSSRPPGSRRSDANVPDPKSARLLGRHICELWVQRDLGSGGVGQEGWGMRRALALTAILLAAAASFARGEGYPTKPVTIIVPTSPGGPPDTLARLLSEPMRASLGQPIVVENATGAGGTAGVARVI